MSSKCSYPNCQGTLPEGTLKQCAIEGCGNRLYDPCQADYERSQNVDWGLHGHFLVVVIEKLKQC